MGQNDGVPLLLEALDLAEQVDALEAGMGCGHDPEIGSASARRNACCERLEGRQPRKQLDREVADVDRSRILTSVLKRLDIGVYEAISQYVAGDQIPPIELTMANGGIGYSTTGGRFDSWAAQLDDAISAVTGGTR